MQAKHAAGWYAGVPVRISAQVTEDPPRPHPPWSWYATSLAIAVVTVLVGAALYARQPDPYPVHWDASGQPDSFTAASLPAVFAAVLGMLGLVAVLAFVSVMIARLPARKYPDGDPEGAEHRRLAVQHGLQSGLGLLTVLVTAGMAALQIVIWSGITGNGLVTAGIGFTVLVAAAVLLLLLRLARAGTQRPGLGTATGDTPGPQSPDDDTSWKAGMAVSSCRRNTRLTTLDSRSLSRGAVPPPFLPPSPPR